MRKAQCMRKPCTVEGPDTMLFVVIESTANCLAMQAYLSPVELKASALTQFDAALSFVLLRHCFILTDAVESPQQWHKLRVIKGRNAALHPLAFLHKCGQGEPEVTSMSLAQGGKVESSGS